MTWSEEESTLQTVLQDLPHVEVFMPAIASSYAAATLPDEYYRSEEEYEQALSDALREEYRAIVDAGFILQIDDPRLVTYSMMHPELSVADCRKWAAKRVEAINDSLACRRDNFARFCTTARHHCGEGLCAGDGGAGWGDDGQTAGTKQLSVVSDASKDVQSEPVELTIAA